MSLFPPARPALRVRVLPRLPAGITSGPGLKAALAAGLLTVGLNYQGVDLNPGDLTNRQVLVWNAVTGAYERAPVTALPVYAQPRTQALLNVMTLGAVGNDPVADTAAINAAVAQLNNSSQQGDLYFPPIGKPFRHTGQIQILNDAVNVRGQACGGRNSAGSTLMFENGSLNGIVFGDTTAETSSGGVTGGGAVDLRLDGTLKTGGALLKVSKSADVVISRVTAVTKGNGFDVYGSNNTKVLGCRISLQAGSAEERFCLKWSGDDVKRSDGLNLNDTILDAGGVGINIIWDGFAHSLGIDKTKMLYGLRGLWVRNLLASHSNYPQFLEAMALHFDGGTGSALLVEVGRGFRLIVPDFYNLPGDHAVQLLKGPATDPTANIQIDGGRIGNAGGDCIYCEAQYVRIVGVQMTDGSKLGAGQYGALHFGGSAYRIQVDGGWAGSVQGTAENHGYAVKLDQGARYIDIDGLDCGGAQRGLINNSTGSDITLRLLYAAA